MKKLVLFFMLTCSIAINKLVNDHQNQQQPIDKAKLHRRLINTKERQNDEREIQQIMVQLSRNQITEEEAKKKLRKKKFFGEIWDGVKSAASSVGSAVMSGVTALTGLGAEGPPIHKDSPNVFMMPIINPVSTPSTVISPAAATELDKPSSYPTVSPMIQAPQGQSDSKKSKDDDKDDKDGEDGKPKDDVKPDQPQEDGTKKDRKLKRKVHKPSKIYVKGIVNEDSDIVIHHHKKTKH